MTKYKIGDRVKILRDQIFGDAPNGVYKEGEIHTINYVDKDGDPTFEGDDSEFGWANPTNWFQKIEPVEKPCDCDDKEDVDEKHAIPITGGKPLSGGLNDHYLADVKNPQRGGPGYLAEADDIIFTMRMTFDEGEAFKAIWRSCAARLGYGKPGSNAVYDAEKIVHRGARILQRAKLDA